MIMGDGRYYTYAQFFNILFFMIYIMLLTGVICNIYYRAKKTKRINYIIGILTIGLVMVVSRFLEEVIYNREVGAYMKVISCLCLIAIISGTMILLIIREKQWVKYLVYIYFIVPILGVIALGKELIIQHYTFSAVTYSPLYIIYLLTGVLLLAILCLLKEIKNIKKGERIFCISIIVPLCIYIVNISWLSMNELHYYIAFISIIIIYFTLLNYMSSQVVSGVFDNIEKQLDDIIFLTDEKGVIIHKNREEQQLNQLFNIKNPINILEPYQIFVDKIISSTKLESAFEVEILFGTEIRFFSITSYKLRSTKKQLGYVFVIKEITETANMLKELIKKNIDLENLNKELTDYSEVVYKYETEKGINNLMNDINDRLGHQIIELSLITQKAYDEIASYNSTSELAIDEVMKVAKRNLQDVRAAVTKYRSFYEEVRND